MIMKCPFQSLYKIKGIVCSSGDVIGLAGRGFDAPGYTRSLPRTSVQCLTSVWVMWSLKSSLPFRCCLKVHQNFMVGLHVWFKFQQQVKYLATFRSDCYRLKKQTNKQTRQTFHDQTNRQTNTPTPQQTYKQTNKHTFSEIIRIIAWSAGPHHLFALFTL